MLDIAGHLAFALIALSFLVRDILWLRALSITASVASIIYAYFAPAQPLWLVMGWNGLFIGLNLVQIAILFRERRGVTFTDEEKELFQTSFSRFAPVEFMCTGSASGSVPKRSRRSFRKRPRLRRDWVGHEVSSPSVRGCAEKIFPLDVLATGFEKNENASSRPQPDGRIYSCFYRESVYGEGTEWRLR